MKHNAVVQAELDKIYLGQLPIIGSVIGIYYCIITITHFLVLPSDILAPIAASSFGAAFTATAVYWFSKRGKISARSSHIAIAPTAALVLVTVFTHIYLSGDQLQLTNAALIMYAMSLVTLWPALFIIFMAVCTIGFALMLNLLPGDYTVHIGFMGFASILLSSLGFTLRYKALYKSVRLLVGSRQKTRNLSAASRKIKSQMAEVQEANAARDIFLANVTHELRTPLTGVLGMLELMDDTELNDDQEFLVSTAQKSAGFLMHIINDLLDFAKLEAGKLELNLEPVDIIGLTKDVVSTFKAAARQKDLILSCDADGPFPPLIEVDGPRLSQILLNLISNAVKFTEKGSVTVTVTLESEEGMVRWTVADTGSGITPEQQKKLFQRFEQLDGSKTRRKEGTGLGLAIAYELTELFEGTITVDSELGRGTQFTVTLPLNIAQTSAALGTAAAPPANEDIIAPPAQLQLRALVAEDNEINQIILKKVLAKFGINVTVVANGQHAVTAVQDAAVPFDLIFMDVQMPIMDGVTATRLINETIPSPPPIIAITANTMDSDIETYLAAGMRDFVGKPINFDNFQEVIERVLKKQVP